MTAITSALTTSGPSTRLVNATELQKATGLAIQVQTVAELNALIASVPLWYDKQDIRVLAEAPGVLRQWDATNLHARNATLPGGAKVVLAADANTITSVTTPGQPPTATVVNGDIKLDQLLGVYYTGTGGVWTFTDFLQPSKIKNVTTTTYTVQPTDRKLNFTNAAGCTVTLAAPIPTTFECTYVANNGGALTFVPSGLTSFTNTLGVFTAAAGTSGALVCDGAADTVRLLNGAPAAPSSLGHVASQAAMVALTTAVKGSSCYRDDLGGVRMELTNGAAGAYATAANWERAAPAVTGSLPSAAAFTPTAIPMTGNLMVAAQQNVTGPLNFVIDTTGAADGAKYVVALIANGTNTPTLGGNLKTRGTGTYGTAVGQVTILTFERIAGVYYVSYSQGEMSGFGSGVAAPTHASAVTPQLYFDFNDASKITLSGSSITGITSKGSLTPITLTNTGTNCPTKGSLNSKDVAVFDSALTQYLEATGLSLPWGGTLVAVFKPSSAAANAAIVGKSVGATATTALNRNELLGTITAGKYTTRKANATVSGDAPTAAVAYDTTLALLIGRSAQGSTATTTWHNGGAAATTTTVADGNTQTHFTVGARRSSSGIDFPLAGLVHAILWYSDTVAFTSTEAEEVAVWAATNFGTPNL